MVSETHTITTYRIYFICFYQLAGTDNVTPQSGELEEILFYITFNPSLVSVSDSLLLVRVLPSDFLNPNLVSRQFYFIFIFILSSE